MIPRWLAGQLSQILIQVVMCWWDMKNIVCSLSWRMARCMGCSESMVKKLDEATLELIPILDDIIWLSRLHSFLYEQSFNLRRIVGRFIADGQTGSAVMKLYHGKGKVHPSPDADSAFRFLPVAIATLSVVLMPEDREVLAYLIVWSLEEAVLDKQQSKRRPTSQGRIHRPAFDCSCFECYSSFWSHWDASPNHQPIHEVFDLFEDHMAAAGSDVADRASGRVKNHRRVSRDDNCKQMMSWLEQNRKLEGCAGRLCVGKERDGVAVGMQGVVVPNVEVPEFGKGVGKAKQDVADVDFEDKARQSFDKMSSHSQARKSAASAAELGLMQQVFPDIMGFIAERLWTVWSPPV